jgi:outer membrane protein OmpA-like peptidoglycan-associated protein/tetratricopeptide (TPR) repeat protein
MRKISTVLLLFCTMLCMATSLPAQLKRADKYFNNFQYSKAIPLYEKGLKSTGDPVAYANLAYCYKMVKDYANAEKYYAKAVKSKKTNPVNYYYYGVVLKNDNKPEEAQKQFEAYLEKVPGDKSGGTQVKSCKDVKVWLTQTPLYAVKNASQLNTPGADFSPVFYNNGIVFTSDRGDLDLVEGHNSSNDKAYLSIFYAEIKKQKDDSVTYKKAVAFAKSLNSDYHNGPASFSADGNTIAYNRVNKKLKLSGKNFTNRPQIYLATKTKKNKFGKPVAFPYNSDAYSVGHPCLSPDGQTLYFSSDMPGGIGGKDIYVCHKEGEGWSKPENLGSGVNTDKDEEFPYIRKDGTLFFSSDGLPGFGGLDIFSATKTNGKWGDATNQGAPMNGPTDDFGIVFNEDNSKGYFTSDRKGGKGDDDIYSFVVTSKFIRIAGKIMLSQDLKNPAKNAGVSIQTDDGQEVKRSKTDNAGFFKFENLPADKKYIVKLDESDPAFAGQKKAWMTDEKDKIVRVTVLNNKGGHFVFKNLPLDPNAPPELLTDDDMINIAGNLLAGAPAVPIANQVVYLKNDKGDIVQSTTTNAFGAFAFKDLPPDQNYVVAMEETDTKLSPNTKITITNKSGKEIAVTTLDGKGHFAYKILASDKATMGAMEVTDSDLRLDLKGKLLAGDGSNKALANTTLNIVDEKGKVIQSIKTDANGNFNFVNLPSDQNYFVSVGEGSDPQLAKLDKLVLTDGTGRVIKELKLGKDGKFKFDVLPTDQTKMGYVYVDDPWLKVLKLKQDNNSNKKDSLSIIENIHYAYGEYKIIPEAQNILDKVIQVMKNDPDLVVEVDSHTDSRSTSEYNMTLSKKRASTAVDYIVAHGISASRIKGIGYGESRLLNKCGDGVDCPEEEHAKNRRTEFKITKNVKKK